MICKSCGKVIPDDSVFCPECGQAQENNEDQGIKSFSEVQREQNSEVVVDQPANDNSVNNSQPAYDNQVNNAQPVNGYQGNNSQPVNGFQGNNSQPVNGYQFNGPQNAPQDKTMGIVAYITWIGFIVAMCSSSKDTEFTKFHLNQALVLHIGSLISICIPFIGYLLALVFFALDIVGLIYAANGEMFEIPVIKEIKIIK